MPDELTTALLPRDFDALEYLDLHPDVAASGMGAVEHYLAYGRAEGRPFRLAVPKFVSLHRPVFFCHIPKTAGTSLRFALERGFPDPTIFPDHLTLWRSGGNYPPLDVLLPLLEHQKSAVRLLRGHYPLILRTVLDNPISITVLREPVARTVSQIGDAIRRWGLDVEDAMAALDKGDLPWGVSSNEMTTFLGTPFEDIMDDLIGPKQVDFQARLTRAVESLATIDVLGVDDLSSISPQLIQLGFNPPKERYNVSVGSVTLSPRRLDVVREHNQADLVLYAQAKKLKGL